jgi:hypothetical protein
MSASTGKLLAATLASYKVRQAKMEPVITKPQSIVFPPQKAAPRDPQAPNFNKPVTREGISRGVSQGLLDRHPEPLPRRQE